MLSPKQSVRMFNRARRRTGRALALLLPPGEVTFRRTIAVRYPLHVCGGGYRPGGLHRQLDQRAMALIFGKEAAGEIARVGAVVLAPDAPHRFHIHWSPAEPAPVDTREWTTILFEELPL